MSSRQSFLGGTRRSPDCQHYPSLCCCLGLSWAPPLLWFVLHLAAVFTSLAQAQTQFWVLAGQALAPGHRPTGWPHICSQDCVFPSRLSLSLLFFCKSSARRMWYTCSRTSTHTHTRCTLHIQKSHSYIYRCTFHTFL